MSSVISIAKQIKSEIYKQSNFLNVENIDDDEFREQIKEIVFNSDKAKYKSHDQKKELIDYIFNSMRKLDVLQPFIENPDITEIMVNGPNKIFIEKNGKTEQIDVSFENSERLEDLIQSIVARVNRSVNRSSPIVDARLEDGSRVNVVLPPIALNGPLLTIRKFSKEPFTMDKLIEFGSISEEAADFLEKLVKAKYNIFISGGTGSGKTTFLNALSGFIPKNERIITIEDSAELKIQGIENIARMETRDSNTEGKGAIKIKDLIKTSLRMRPERIIVGEVRGEEAIDMLQAMNTGHDGSLSTGHANSPKDMLSRLETMILSGSEIPIDAIRRQIASALEIIIHLGRLKNGKRAVFEITEVRGYENGEIKLSPLYELKIENNSEGKKTSFLNKTNNILKNDWKINLL